MKARDLLSVEEMLNLNFLQLCKDTMATFKRNRNGRTMCFSSNNAMIKVTHDN